MKPEQVLCLRCKHFWADLSREGSTLHIETDIDKGLCPYHNFDVPYPDCSDFEEVPCMRCLYHVTNHVIYHEQLKKDIFCVKCLKLNKFVGLPIRVCEHFQSNSHQSHLYQEDSE